MALDRRQSRSGVIALFSTKFSADSDANSVPRIPAESVGKLRGWGPTLLQLCASWWRSLREESASSRADTASGELADKQAGDTH